jgi:hypothetical protein
MPIIGNGLDYATGSPLFEPIDEQTFGQRLQASLGRNASELAATARATQAGRSYRGEVERERGPDLGDPRAAGWTFLVNGADPQLDAIVQAIEPLAKHRGMKDPAKPLIYRDEPMDEWFAWLLDNYAAFDTDQAPHYVLFVGGPDQLPFGFQALLDSAGAAGRVDFDGSLDDLRAYVDKVIRLERARSPVAGREAIVFAPDGGYGDATFYSHRYMAAPLVDLIRQKRGLPVRALLGREATRERLQETLCGSRPALVYTASHGLGAPSVDLAEQRRLNGAICCQPARGEPLGERLFTAADAPLDEPFLEGSIFFQFACFGYGTPAESDFKHWLDGPGLNAEADFVAALPKRLLAHPRGPIAYVGHVDTAWLHGFADPDDPNGLAAYDQRLAPFARAVHLLLGTEPVGLAMADLNKRYDTARVILASTYDRLKRGRIQATPEFYRRLADAFITRNDAQNYLVFGDPAARVRLPRRG